MSEVYNFQFRNYANPRKQNPIKPELDFYKVINENASLIPQRIQEWLEGYKKNNIVAQVELLLLILEACCGKLPTAATFLAKGIKMDDHYMYNIDTSNLASIPINMVVGKLMNVTKIVQLESIIDRHSFRDGLLVFWKQLVAECRDGPLFDEIIFKKCMDYIICLSRTSESIYRQMATVIGLQLLDSFIAIAETVDFEKHKPTLELMMMKLFQGLLVMRYTDSDDYIHTQCQSPKPPIAHLSISWFRGNTLRVTVLRPPSDSDSDNASVGGRVVEWKLDTKISNARWREIAYGSITPFAHLQKNRSTISNPLDMSYVMEYSKDISSLLGSSPEHPDMVFMKVEKPTSIKAAWALMEIFYADKQSQPWLLELLADWLADNDSLLSSVLPTVYSKIVNFQNELSSIQIFEDNPTYWDVLSSALAVGWFDVVVKMLHLHGSYQPHEINKREMENGLVEAIVILVSEKPRMRPKIEGEKLGKCFETKLDFTEAWEKWREIITKLDCSDLWLECHHRQTREGLKTVIQIMLGNIDIICNKTCHWIELLISHFTYISPYTVGIQSMHSLAQDCINLKQVEGSHTLMDIFLGILAEDTNVVLTECTREFGPWMVAHAIELLTTGSDQAESFLHEEHNYLGGMSIAQLHRLNYARVLSSHPMTWHIAPIYMSSCKHGMGFLKILLSKLPTEHDKMLLKNREICLFYKLDDVGSNLMKIAGVYHWKHGRKGLGVFWLQQARDEVRLRSIAQQLFDYIGKPISDESFKQWEGLIELLGSETGSTWDLNMLHKYRDFKKSLKQVSDGLTTDAAQRAVESLMWLMKNPSTPQHLWLPILHESLKLLNWQERPLLNESETYLLLNKLQELSMAMLHRPLPDVIVPDLPADALPSVCLALGCNLRRAFLEEL